MHEVRCEKCNKVLGIITDELVRIIDGDMEKELPVYKAIETVNFMTPYGFIDGSIPHSYGTICSACSNKMQTSGETADKVK